MTSLPFSYIWLVKQALKGRFKTILDLGCGTGMVGTTFNTDNRYQITGVDIFVPYLKQTRQTGKYQKVIRANLNKKLAFTDNSFDIVILLETIEHLRRSGSLKLIAEAERVARYEVIISCPTGITKQEEYDQNQYQKHLSTWYPQDFKKLGYKVYGVGLKAIYGQQTHVDYQLNPLMLPLFFLSFLANPLANLFPQISCQMVASKKLTKSLK